MCRVEEGGRRVEIGALVVVVDGEEEREGEVRCLPAWTRRMEFVGAEVRRERRWRRVDRVVSEGTVRGMAGGSVSWCFS